MYGIVDLPLFVCYVQINIKCLALNQLLLFPVILYIWVGLQEYETIGQNIPGNKCSRISTFE